MKSIFSSVLLLVSLLFSTGSNAAYLRCDRCSDAQIRSVAYNAPLGEHYIADFSNGGVRAFRRSGPRTGQTLVEIAVPGDVRDAAELMAEIYQATSGSLRKEFVVDSDSLGIIGLGGANAYDFIDDAPLRSRVQSYLWANYPFFGSDGVWSPILSRLQTSFGPGARIVGWFYGLKFAVRIVFNDGSSVVVDLDFSSESAEYREGSAKDQHDQSCLEDNSRRYAGSYHFPGGDGAADFIDRAIRMGIPVTGGSSGTRVSCSWDGSHLHCVVSNI